MDGRTIQAEGGAAVIDKGSGDAAFDGLNVVKGQENLAWNGALRFVVGPQASAACYDANGNMTWRLRDGVAYEQVWDAENRLTQVKQNGNPVATFTYDGDGKRVKKVEGGQTTIYVGAHYEKNITTGVATSYYYAGGVRVAMRQGGVVYYLLTDHLGSTAITANSSGVKVGELRYRAYGETRYTSGTTPTSFRYTGQQEESGLGLYLMGARWYDPALSRWLSPDTLVPEAGEPQAFNRYSYVLGNPLRYVDPSGYDPLDEEWQEEFRKVHGRDPEWYDILIRLFSIAFPDEWDWSAFYDENGAYIEGSLEGVLKDSVLKGFNSRSWADIPDALERLAGWYNNGEERLFARDIGTLFGGLKDRFEEPDAWQAISFGDNPAHVWVYVSEEGLKPFMLGVDKDANIHHWAWGLAMGAEYGPGGSVINTGREVVRHIEALWNGNANWGNMWADTWIGNTGAALGWRFRLLGIRDIRTAWSIYMMGWLP